MKVKTRTAVPVTYPIGQRLGDTGGWKDQCELEEALAQFASPNHSNGSVDANESYIEYDVGKGMNYCLHIHDKLTVSPYAWGVYSRCWYKSSTSKYVSSAWTGTWAPVIPSEPSTFEVTNEMRRRAWADIYPEVNNGLDLAVTIFEFRDFSRLLKTARSVLKYAKTFQKNALKTNLNNLSKLSAETFLSWMFGIAPLIRDFDGIVEDLLNLREVIDEFRRRGEQVLPYHYKEVLESQHSSVQYGNGYKHTFTESTYYCTCHMSYYYSVPPFWEAALRVGGLRVTLSTVWNVIPWSFIVDWLVNVNKFLEQFDKDPNVTVKVHDYCDTVKSITRNEYHRSTDTPFGVGLNYPDGAGSTTLSGLLNTFADSEYRHPIWTWKRVHYKRQPGLPETGYAIPVLDGDLSNTQLVLCGALARARI